MIRATLSWEIKSYVKIHRIEDDLGIPRYISVNYETDVELDDSKQDEILGLERIGILRVLPLKERRPLEQMPGTKVELR